MREFARLRMHGDRFNAPKIPVASLADLSLFEEVIVEIAKSIFLREHSGRQRVPKGFVKRLSLALNRVEGGSKAAVLDRVDLDDQQAPLFDDPDEFDRAFEILISSIEEPSDPLANGLPPDVIRRFRSLGKGLQRSESIEFISPRGPSATYTPEKRRLILSHAGESYTEPAMMLGRIAALDDDRHEFRIVSDDGTSVVVPYREESFDDLHAAFVHPWTEGKMIRVEGELEFSSEGEPQRFESADVVVVGKREWAEQRLDELSELDEEWLGHGLGSPIASDALRLMRQFLSSFDDLGVEQPRMAPSSEGGGIAAEWVHSDIRINLEVEPDGAVYYLAFRFSTKEILDEREFGHAKLRDVDAIARTIKGVIVSE